MRKTRRLSDFILPEADVYLQLTADPPPVILHLSGPPGVNGP